MTATPLTFRPIELPRDADACIQHRIDSYVVSFGDARRFFEENGADGAKYLAWLAEHSHDPETCVLAYDGDEVVGHIEAVHSPEHRGGYVFLYYVVPSRRRQGLGAQLDDYVTRLFSGRGCKRLALTVSATNANAIRFYEARGWVDAGPRPGRPGERRMERSLAGGDGPNS